MDYLIMYPDSKKETHYNINRTSNHCFTGSKVPSDLEAEWSFSFIWYWATQEYIPFFKDGTTEMSLPVS